ncbi:hypothetical protein GOP47_0007657 [Adiantum capillus-veneris]|uniref:Uncharacterized protein n=1 Tax=Adiantum capillus-veneris TaxID=13818 RepID=A0A9D4V1B2_ADICA|nr:hypothetical protein GOP47_0007657 [Adiantum capillus-veneris]
MVGKGVKDAEVAEVDIVYKDGGEHGAIQEPSIETATEQRKHDHRVASSASPFECSIGFEGREEGKGKWP